MSSLVSFSELFGEAKDILEWRLSGGSANTNPYLSIGGAISTTRITSGRVSNLWNTASEAQTIAGFTDYRLLYLYNKSTNETVLNPLMVYTPQDDFVSVEISHRPINAICQLLIDSFESPDENEIGLPTETPSPWKKCTDDVKTTKAFFEDIPPLSFQGVWFRRIVPANTEKKTGVKNGLTILGRAQ